VTERFKVRFLEEAAEFLDGLDGKPERKLFTMSGRLKQSMINPSSGNFLVKLGNSGLYSIKHIIGYLHSGTNLTNLILL